jgi:gamma-glutamylcyclotransferase (GGCT)/AIG2-like uncharacterized protein YtfP
MPVLLCYRRIAMQNRARPQSLLYFAYGSNMSTARLRERIGSVRRVAVARLTAHALRFHKRGRDGTAKCDACYTGERNDTVYGVVFGIPAHARSRLDAFEGAGNGYEPEQVTVTALGGSTLRALTYRATHIDTGLLPLHWYHEHVLRGALEHGLPPEYIDAIRRISVLEDPDQGRAARELALHSGAPCTAPD